ncbi:MAG: hypothetical protein R3237_05510 [Nitrosopumilaceae archaeon]|nr:hypothetical protein [Nitrosopumilaceae archaeon]
MKTRYKIFLVISSFVVFYLSLIPVMQFCLESYGDCSLWQELILLTRPVIVSDDLQWSGTVDGIEHPSLNDQFVQNLPFVVSMVILPFVIIGFVVIWERK